MMKMIKPDLQRGETCPPPEVLRKAPHVAANRAANLGALVGQSAARAATSAGASATAFMVSPGAQTWNEWLALQSAVAQRYARLQNAWWQGWCAWAQDCTHLRRADTLSEFTEQQYNLVAQLGALARDQATDLLSLQENIQVDYGYWATRVIANRDDQ
jgi:hypothetical protein